PQIGATGVTNLTTTGATGVFTIDASSLTPGTMYSFAAYATNSAGTTYTSPATTFATIQASTSTAVSASPTATFSSAGQSVTLGATVTAGSGTVNQGTVTFTVVD